MWLINANTLELEYFQECPVGEYAILSHTWGANAEELTFEEFKVGEGRGKIGFYKIQKCCEQAQRDGLPYAWVDTCCIDKRSSTELSEAINSMFTWYERAKLCYAYLTDIHYYDPPLSSDDTTTIRFQNSRWFTRGWTLQELVAPKFVSFYTHHWEYISDKSHLVEELYSITKIDRDVLASTKSFLDCPISQRMAWASHRQTTRLEDSAYCLIGLFRANMPLLYGEGARAFTRLQEMILQESDDETIFAWTGVGEEGTGLLASSPASFTNSGHFRPGRGDRYERPPYAKTNRGLSIECRALPCAMNTYVVPLQCEQNLQSGSEQSKRGNRQIAIFLCRTSNDDQYRRIPFQGRCIDDVINWDMSRAKVLKAFVPGDARTLELSPHSGLPVMHIEFNSGNVHRFPKLTAAPSTLRSRDSENKAKHEGTGAADKIMCPWTPENVTQVKFERRDMEIGIVIAFDKSDGPRSLYHSYVEVGFDMEFRPICVLHTAQFRLQHAPTVWPTTFQWQLLFTFLNLWFGFCASFWLEYRYVLSLPDPPNGTNPSYILMLVEYWMAFVVIIVVVVGVVLDLRFKNWRNGLSVRQSFWTFQGFETSTVGCIADRDHLIQQYTSRIKRVFHLYWLFKDRFQDPRRLWVVKGDRFVGLELSTKDQLPSEYGCADIELKIKHLHGLEWQLQYREVPLHSGKHQRAWLCKRRALTTLKRSESLVLSILVLFMCTNQLHPSTLVLIIREEGKAVRPAILWTLFIVVGTYGIFIGTQASKVWRFLSECDKRQPNHELTT